MKWVPPHCSAQTGIILMAKLFAYIHSMDQQLHQQGTASEGEAKGQNEQGAGDVVHIQCLGSPLDLVSIRQIHQHFLFLLFHVLLNELGIEKRGLLRSIMTYD